MVSKDKKGSSKGIQTVFHNCRGYEKLRRLEQNIQQGLAKILHQEELAWFERSRAKWFTDGDRNTRYYHVKAFQRKRKNKILMIRGDGGEWTEDAWKIKNKFKDNFHTLFTSDTETSYEAL